MKPLNSIEDILADIAAGRMVVMLDEPQPTAETFGFRTAGWNVAPVVSKTISRIAPISSRSASREPPRRCFTARAARRAAARAIAAAPGSTSSSPSPRTSGA